MKYGDGAGVARRIEDDSISTVVTKNAVSRARKVAGHAAKERAHAARVKDVTARSNDLMDMAGKEIADGAARRAAASRTIEDAAYNAARSNQAKQPRTPLTGRQKLAFGAVGTGTVAGGVGTVQAVRRRRGPVEKGYWKDLRTTQRAVYSGGRKKEGLGVMLREGSSPRTAVPGAVGGVAGHYGGGKLAEHLARNQPLPTREKAKVAGQTIGRAIGVNVGTSRGTRRGAAEIRRRGIAKGITRQGVLPVLARRLPAAGRNGRRIITGKSIGTKAKLFLKPTKKVVAAQIPKQYGGVTNIRPGGRMPGLNIGKADVEKFSPTGAFRSLLATGRAAAGGAKAGLAGMKPASILPSAQTASHGTAVGRGAKVGGFAATRPGATAGIIGGSAAAAGVGTGYALHRNVGKADLLSKRRYDPEDERRQQRGVMTGAAGVTGLGALGQSYRLARRDGKSLTGQRDLGDFSPLRPMRDATPLLQRKATKKNPLAEPDDEYKARLDAHTAKHKEKHAAYGRLQHARDVGEKVKGRKLIAVGGRSAGYGAAGIALIGTAGALHRGRKDERWD